MDYSEFKLLVARNFSSNIGKKINSDCVDSILLSLDRAYQLGIAEAYNKTAKGVQDVADTPEEIKATLKDLVKGIRRCQGDLFDKDFEYSLEDLLDTIERW